MTLIQDQQEIVGTFTEELTRFTDTVRSLDAAQLAATSRCSGWTAGDVAAHVSGTMADIAAGRIEGQGTPAVTRRQVIERLGWSGSQLAEELTAASAGLLALAAGVDAAGWEAPVGAGFDGALGLAVEALLYDTVVHADDIAQATGVSYVWTVPATTACVSHVLPFLAAKGWGPVLLALDGLPEIGSGERVKGDARDFVLAATGRVDSVEWALPNIYA